MFTEIAVCIKVAHQPGAVATIEGSTKYRVSEVHMVVFERKFGFHASISSITNIFFKAISYAEIVSYNTDLS